jgi:hypothetical protein
MYYFSGKVEKKQSLWYNLFTFQIKLRNKHAKETKRCDSGVQRGEKN